MDSIRDRFNYLLKGYHDLSLTREELAEFFAMVRDTDSRAWLEEQFDHDIQHMVPVETVSEEQAAARYAAIRTAITLKNGHVRHLPFAKGWWWAAAAIVILLGAAYFWIDKGNNGSAPTVARATDIQPGRHGAVLTLADGTKIVLDSMDNGLVAAQNGADVVLRNGRLTYDKNGGTPLTNTTYNTMTTPKGRQFQLLLPDGSKVWLNAASSLTYPTSFTGKERIVTMTGEAYFEVAKNTSVPFIVQVNEETKVQVLGTHFNVNAYPEEIAMKTTLLEGSVQVARGVHEQILKPGQQAEITTGIKLNTEVNIEQVVAWKEGGFDFNGLSLQEVMRQIARWYDVEVVYEQGVPAIRLWGSIGRDLTLVQLLESLQAMEVHYKIEGRKLTILP